MSTPPRPPSLADLASALETGEDVAAMAPRPVVGAEAPAPSPAFTNVAGASGTLFGMVADDDVHTHSPVEASFHDMRVDDLPPTMRHLAGELQKIQVEHMTQLRQRAVPGCPGCTDYDDSYQALLRHLVALQEAAVIASKVLKEARGRYAQSMREAFTEQADQYENLSSNPRSLDDLNDAEQANLIPAFAQGLREAIVERSQSLVRSEKEEMKKKLRQAEVDRATVLQGLDHARVQLDNVRSALSATLGASDTLIDGFLNGDTDLAGMLATVLGNAGGPVKINAMHAALYLSSDKPEEPLGELNAKPTTLNAAIFVGEGASPPPPASGSGQQQSATPQGGRSGGGQGGRSSEGQRNDGPKGPPQRPPVIKASQSPVAAENSDDKRVKDLLQVLARRGVVPASVVLTHLKDFDDDQLKRLVQKMNRQGAGISWFPGDGDGLLAATASFMAYYENYFEKFSETDDAHRGYLGWLTVQKMCEQPQIAGVAPLLTTLLKSNWTVRYPVRFQGVSGSRAPVGIHIVRPAIGDNPGRDGLVVYVPDAKMKSVPKVLSEQKFDVLFVYAANPATALIPRELQVPRVFGIPKASGTAGDPDSWKQLKNS